MEKKCDKDHPDHSVELKSLNRLGGQVEGVKKMIQEKRYCIDIIMQLKAIQSAAKSIEANIMKSHIQACVREALFQSGEKIREEKINELIKLFKRY